MTERRLPHYCHARGCEVRVPPRMFMCRKHWYMLTAKLRAKIYKHYSPGQENRMDPSEKYVKWAQRSID